MGRPKGTKNVMRTPEAKEAIVLEAIENGAMSSAHRHRLSPRLLRAWMAKYWESGLDGLTSRTENGG